MQAFQSMAVTSMGVAEYSTGFPFVPAEVAYSRAKIDTFEKIVGKPDFAQSMRLQKMSVGVCESGSLIANSREFAY